MSSSPAGSLKDIQIDIIHELQTDINTQFKMLVKSRALWRKIENWSETIAHILMIVSAVLSFASGQYKSIEVLPFLAGIVSVLVIALLKFANYAKNECLERNILLKPILERVGVKPIPINTNT